MTAFLSGSPAVIVALLDAEANPNARTEGGSTPLHLAARQRLAVIVALLEAGVDPTVRSEDGITLLHLSALSNDSPAVIKALLDAGADPVSRNVSGLRPLHMAAMTNKFPSLIVALLEAGPTQRRETARAKHLGTSPRGAMPSRTRTCIGGSTTHAFNEELRSSVSVMDPTCSSPASRSA